MSDTVRLKLAHPIAGTTCDRLGIPRNRHETGEELELSRPAAQALIAAGYAAGVDPEDRDSVRAALAPPEPAEPTQAGDSQGVVQQNMDEGVRWVEDGDDQAPADPAPADLGAAPVVVEPSIAEETATVLPPPEQTAQADQEPQTPAEAPRAAPSAPRAQPRRR